MDLISSRLWLSWQKQWNIFLMSSEYIILRHTTLFQIILILKNNTYSDRKPLALILSLLNKKFVKKLVLENSNLHKMAINWWKKPIHFQIMWNFIDVCIVQNQGKCAWPYYQVLWHPVKLQINSIYLIIGSLECLLFKVSE